MQYQPGFLTISTSHKLPHMSDLFLHSFALGLMKYLPIFHFLDAEAWARLELVVVRLVLPRLHFFTVFSTHSYWLRHFWSRDCFAINSDPSFFFALEWMNSSVTINLKQSDCWVIWNIFASGYCVIKPNEMQQFMHYLRVCATKSLLTVIWNSFVPGWQPYPIIKWMCL